MTTLSPQAQAVLDAFENASDGEYVEGVWVVNERTMLSAALRAAAKQSTFADVAVNKTIEVVPVDILLTIAAELEGQ
jgi:hypothetical protein